jgi:tight adherence protein B
VTGTGVLTVLAAVLAAALVVPGVPRPPAPAAPRRRVPVVLAALATATLVVVGPSAGALATVLAVAALAGWRIRGAQVARREADATGVRVLETCESLAAELAAGRPPGVALDRARAEWPVLAPVAEAQRVGADVPDAWRSLAALPGAGDLRVVAAAWQVAHRTGEGLADTLDRVALGLRDDATTRRVVRGELASARATAKLVAVLPLLALTMGNGAGGDPWGFLLGHPVGLVCLALGLAFALAGLAWIEALAREVDRP